MNTDFSDVRREDCSCIQVEIRLEESWLDRFLWEKQLEIPINDQYTLINIRVNLGEGLLKIQAELKDKPGTSIQVSATPTWDNQTQSIRIDNLDVDMNSKNFLMKTAGWLASNVLNSTLDKKIEEQANKLFKRQLEKLKTEPLAIPIPKGGTANVKVENITIDQLLFIEHAMEVKASIDAYWKFHLL